MRRYTSLKLSDADVDEIEFRVNLPGGLDFHVDQELYGYDIDDARGNWSTLTRIINLKDIDLPFRWR